MMSARMVHDQFWLDSDVPSHAFGAALENLDLIVGAVSTTVGFHLMALAHPGVRTR